MHACITALFTFLQDTETTGSIDKGAGWVTPKYAFRTKSRSVYTYLKRAYSTYTWVYSFNAGGFGVAGEVSIKNEYVEFCISPAMKHLGILYRVKDNVVFKDPTRTNRWSVYKANRWLAWESYNELEECIIALTKEVESLV